MKLYDWSGACSLAPHIALKEAWLPVDLIRVNVAKRQVQGCGDFGAINPLGRVPVLALDDGELLTEGLAILPLTRDA
jgi:glutathione S-transferase